MSKIDRDNYIESDVDVKESERKRQKVMDEFDLQLLMLQNQEEESTKITQLEATPPRKQLIDEFDQQLLMLQNQEEESTKITQLEATPPRKQTIDEFDQQLLLQEASLDISMETSEIEDSPQPVISIISNHQSPVVRPYQHFHPISQKPILPTIPIQHLNHFQASQPLPFPKPQQVPFQPNELRSKESIQIEIDQNEIKRREIQDTLDRNRKLNEHEWDRKGLIRELQVHNMQKQELSKQLYLISNSNANLPHVNNNNNNNNNNHINFNNNNNHINYNNFNNNIAVNNNFAILNNQPLPSLRISSQFQPEHLQNPLMPQINQEQLSMQPKYHIEQEKEQLLLFKQEQMRRQLEQKVLTQKLEERTKQQQIFAEQQKAQQLEVEKILKQQDTLSQPESHESLAIFSNLPKDLQFLAAVLGPEAFEESKKQALALANNYSKDDKTREAQLKIVQSNLKSSLSPNGSKRKGQKKPEDDLTLRQKHFRSLVAEQIVKIVAKYRKKGELADKEAFKNQCRKFTLKVVDTEIKNDGDLVINERMLARMNLMVEKFFAKHGVAAKKT